MPEYFDFKVSLRHVEPRIWRRFLLSVADSTFQDLHEAIQDACGWWNYHVFGFRRALGYEQPIAGIPIDDELDMFGSTAPDAGEVRLAEFFGDKRAKKCIYEYDFGDCWLHDVKLLGIVEIPETFRRRLVGGERAFPHEDCGGIGGYQRCVEFVHTGKDSLENDPGGLREWLGGWHPEHFDLAATKAKFDRGAVKTRREPKSRPSVKGLHPGPDARRKRRKKKPTT